MMHTEILNSVYNEAERRLVKNNMKPTANKLSKAEIQLLVTVERYSEKSRGVLAVLITSLVQKIFNPKQDVLRYQDNMEGGYSGRGIDTKEVIENYVENLKIDKTIKFEHKDVWNKIVAGTIRSLKF